MMGCTNTQRSEKKSRKYCRNKNYLYFCGVEFKDKANGREERQ
jgi:hypothetical protein